MALVICFTFFLCLLHYFGGYLRFCGGTLELYFFVIVMLEQSVNVAFLTLGTTSRSLRSFSKSFRLEATIKLSLSCSHLLSCSLSSLSSLIRALPQNTICGSVDLLFHCVSNN